MFDVHFLKKALEPVNGYVIFNIFKMMEK